MNDDPRQSIDALVTELEGRGLRVKGKEACCPWHEDANPSASLLLGSDGIWRIYCHRCDRRGHVLDLRAESAGRPVADLLRELPKNPPAPTPTSRPSQPERPAQTFPDLAAIRTHYGARLLDLFPYTDPASGRVDLIVARLHGEGTKSNGKPRKAYHQLKPADAGGFTYGKPDGLLPLANRGALASDPSGPVLVVEGEPCVKALRSLGILATTAPGGAGKAAGADWSPLRGRIAVLWPDSDPADPKTGKRAGPEHMAEVAKILDGMGCTVSMIDPDALDLPPGGDVVDLLDRLDGKSAADLAVLVRDIMAGAEPMGASAELAKWYADVEAGKWAALAWPLVKVGKLSRATLPGSLALLCADPGAGKSWLMLQLAAAWHQAGHRVAVRMLEDERRAHLARLLAHLDGCSDLTDDGWLRSHPGRGRDALVKHRAMIDAIGRCIVAEDEAPPSLSDLVAWTEAQAKAGARVVILDPITGAASEREPWAADFSAAMALKRIARQHGCSILLTSHPRGTAQRGPALSSMAGGSAWPRFAHAVLWLERFDPTEVRLWDGDVAACNRSVRVLKCRHGRGSGLSIGLRWHEDAARFDEVGVLANDDQAMKRAHAPRHARADGHNAEMQARGEKLRQPPSASEDAFADEQGPT